MNLPVGRDLSLQIRSGLDESTAYPTSRLQKGLLLFRGGLDLTEEAVGFGVPLINQGIHTLFPGEVILDSAHSPSSWKVTADYCLNRVERTARPDKTNVRGASFYFVKNSLSALMRRFQLARGPLMNMSSALRKLSGWETTYEQTARSARVKMTYAFDTRTRVLAIEADLSGPMPDGTTEVIIMNEQGAHYFDVYSDSSGNQLSGKKVGCWDKVTASEAGFASPIQRVAFTVPQAPGSRLFRGRELAGSRLAWAGFGYSIRPTTRVFSYWLKIEELP